MFAPVLAPCLAVFKLFTSVQLVPFQVSTLAVIYGEGPGFPPATIADVDNPPPASTVLPSFKLFTSVHELPFHNSVLFLLSFQGEPPSPPTNIAEV